MLHQIVAWVVALVVAWLLANGYNADQAKYQVSPVPVPAPTAAPVCWHGYCQGGWLIR